MIERFMWGTLYGLAGAIITVGTAITALPAMPDAFGWLKLAAGGAVSFAFAVYAYMRDPERAWSNTSEVTGKLPPKMERVK